MYHRHQPTAEMLFYALTGSCIHEAERNVELLLSTGRISFDQEPGRASPMTNHDRPMTHPPNDSPNDSPMTHTDDSHR